MADDTGLAFPLVELVKTFSAPNSLASNPDLSPDDGDSVGPVVLQSVYTGQFAYALPPGIQPNPDLKLTPASSDDGNKWYLTNIEGNFCRIKNKKTGLYVAVGGSLQDGAYANEKAKKDSLTFAVRQRQPNETYWLITPTQLGPEMESLWWTANNGEKKVQYIKRNDQNAQYWIMTKV